MEESEIYRRLFNPFLLHLQKMELELRCPSCLNMLSHPVMLPCNHVFCSSCISRTTGYSLDCSLCKIIYNLEDVRSLPQMENMVNIYKGLGNVFHSNHFHPELQTKIPGEIKLSDQNLGYVSANGNKGDGQNTPDSTFINAQCFTKFPHNKRVQLLFHPTESNKNIWTRQEGENAQKNVDQTNSSPSFSNNNKDSDKDSTDPASDHKARGLSDEDRQRKESENASAKMNGSSNFSGGATYNGDLKNHTDGNILDMHTRNPHTQQMGMEHKGVSMDLMSSNCPSFNATCCPGSIRPPNHSDQLKSKTAFVCAFCQSSKESEATGPMLHYVDGKEIQGVKANQSNVSHVHRKCVDWAPQVYFINDIAIDLESEVARGAKIKCNICGLKGAALGCYAKSCRRSFHVPCAVENLQCWWDCQNFLMFCPTHSSLKFPSERSRLGKRKLRTYTEPDECLPLPGHEESNKLCTVFPRPTSEWVLCGSALSASEKVLLTKFAKLTGSTLSKNWNARVTHVIAATDEIGACSRTLKVLMAILNGKWILKIDWIKASMDSMYPVDEETHEIRCDVHGSVDGPRNGRLRALEKGPKLFSGLSFYLYGEFIPSYRGYLEDLLLAGGGIILKQNDIRISDNTQKVVIYSLDPEDCQPDKVSLVLDQRLKDAEAFAIENGCLVAGHTWLLNSIASCSLQPLVH